MVKRLLVRPAQSVVIFAVIIVMAIVLSVALLLSDMRERELAHARLETSSVLQMLMQQTQQNFEAADLVLQAIQERLATPFGRQLALNGEPAHLLLNVRAAGLPQIEAIFLVDARGNAVNSSVGFPVQPVSVADRGYFTELIRRGMGEFGPLVIDKPVRGRKNNRWTVHVARSLENPDGTFRGAVVASMSIPQFEKGYTLMKLDYTRPIALYSEAGLLIASLPHREGMIGSAAPELTREVLPTRANEIRSVRHRRGLGGYEVFAVGHLEHYPLLVSVTDDEVMSLASWREAAAPIVIGAVLMCLFTGVVGVLLNRNVVRQQSLSQALNVATDRYQHTVDSVMDAIVAVDDSLRIVLFNPAAERMFGRAAGEVTGQPVDVLLPDRLRERHREHIGRLFRSGDVTRAMSPQVQAYGLRADGAEFPLESTVSRSLVGDQVQWTAVLRDVTERRRAENELRELNRQLRALYTALQQVREDERTRISRELHDELGQQLTGLKLSLSWLGNRLKDGRPAGPELVDEMRRMLDTASASVRRISTELRPTALEELGFVDAVVSMAREYESRSGFTVELQLDDAAQVGGEHLATALFRIVQESLTNIVRYAEATQVSISVLASGDDLVLTITDDGKGFDVGRKQPGIGLINMRERAHSIGAYFRIDSTPGEGTVVHVTVARDLAASGQGAS